jgi:hypothetical protein
VEQHHTEPAGQVARQTDSPPPARAKVSEGKKSLFCSITMRSCVRCLALTAQNDPLPLLTEVVSHTMALEPPAREITSYHRIDMRSLLLRFEVWCRRGLATCVDSRVAERIVAAAFPIAMKIISAGYLEISSRAAINGTAVANFIEQCPGQPRWIPFNCVGEEIARGEKRQAPYLTHRRGDF